MHPSELAYPCCLPALGRFTRWTPHEGSAHHPTRTVAPPRSPVDSWRAEDSPRGLGRTLGKRVGCTPHEFESLILRSRNQHERRRSTAGTGLAVQSVSVNDGGAVAAPWRRRGGGRSAARSRPERRYELAGSPHHGQLRRLAGLAARESPPPAIVRGTKTTMTPAAYPSGASPVGRLDHALREPDRAVNRIFGWADGVQRRHGVLGFPYAVVKKYGDDDGGREAALITYYGFLSIFPLLLLGVAILSRVLTANPDLQQRLFDEIVPPVLRSTVEQACPACRRRPFRSSPA